MADRFVVIQHPTHFVIKVDVYVFQSVVEIAMYRALTYTKHACAFSHRAFTLQNMICDPNYHSVVVVVHIVTSKIAYAHTMRYMTTFVQFCICLSVVGGIHTSAFAHICIYTFAQSIYHHCDAERNKEDRKAHGQRL